MNTYERLKTALINADELLSLATFDKVVKPDEAERIKAEVKDAIRTPLRNCDVGTAAEQDERFKNFCLSHLSNYPSSNDDGKCWKCPLFKTRTRCPIAWAQMPYEEEVRNEQ